MARGMGEARDCSRGTCGPILIQPTDFVQPLYLMRRNLPVSRLSATVAPVRFAGALHRIATKSSAFPQSSACIVPAV